MSHVTKCALPAMHADNSSEISAGNEGIQLRSVEWVAYPTTRP